MKWQIKVADSLGGGFAGTPEMVWKVVPYMLNPKAPCVFFGMYGLPDFYTLWRWQGRKAILWAGSDIKHFYNGYWLEDGGGIRMEHGPLAEWINKHCESYVENNTERHALLAVGIESKVVPSFLGKVEDYPITYTHNPRPMVYASVSGDNFDMYGWNLINQIAPMCDVDFHLYGNKTPWDSPHSNVFVHGRVSQEQMNEEVKTMQCGLRTLEFDGFSEILAKSVLWGQYPISFIPYPHIDSYKSPDELIQLLNDLSKKTQPNKEAREYYLANLNKYPWNENNN